MYLMRTAINSTDEKEKIDDGTNTLCNHRSNDP